MADDQMMKNAFGDDAAEMAEPPNVEAPTDHVLWPEIVAGMRSVYDPEIPVNIYELGLIYKVEIDEEMNVDVKMTLTAPGCPVAGEMPGMVRDGIAGVEGIGDINVEIVWDPPWDPSMMADTAKFQLNMF